jgi:hypothetical protein
LYQNGISCCCDITSGVGRNRLKMHLLSLQRAWKALLPWTMVWSTWILMYHLEIIYMSKVFHVSIIMFVFKSTMYAIMVLSNMLVPKVFHFEALCFGISNWRLFVCPSACGLCIMSQDNPRTIVFFEKKRILKTTLLVYYPIVISNALVSRVISLENKFQMSMTSLLLMCSSSPRPTYFVTLIPYWWNMHIHLNQKVYRSPLPWSCCTWHY